MPATTNDANARRSEFNPSPVRSQHMPDWLRRRILKTYGARTGGYTAGWSTAITLQRVGDDLQPACSWFDHWGSTKLADGSLAFVTEPYGDLRDLAVVMQHLAGELGCEWFVTDKSFHYPGRTIRGGLYQ